MISTSNSSPQRLYTIGTSGVSRQMYIDELRRLGIRTVADVRGNPRAGRHSSLHRSKEFSRALASASITYMYWGTQLGEDQIELQDEKPLRLLLQGLLASVQHPICLLGHISEALKCHRLSVCEVVRNVTGHEVWHLEWKDHMQVIMRPHAEIFSESEKRVAFFNTCLKQHLVEKSNDREQPVGLECLRWDEITSETLDNGRPYRVLLPFDTEILWYPKWLHKEHADELMETLKGVPLEYPTYSFAQSTGIDQQIKSKRGVARYCEEFAQRHQQVSKASDVEARMFEPWTRELMVEVAKASETVYNCVWVNEYSTGRVGITWHTDLGHVGLGPNPTIGSLSVGATRSFLLKSKRPLGNGNTCQISFRLHHGSLIVMGRNTQTHWLHSVPAEEADGLRFNLTFRFYAREDEAISSRDHPGGNLPSLEVVDSIDAEHTSATTRRDKSCERQDPNSASRVVLVNPVTADGNRCIRPEDLDASSSCTPNEEDASTTRCSSAPSEENITRSGIDCAPRRGRWSSQASRAARPASVVRLPQKQDHVDAPKPAQGNHVYDVDAPKPAQGNPCDAPRERLPVTRVWRPSLSGSLGGPTLTVNIDATSSTASAHSSFHKTRVWKSPSA